MGAIDGKHVNIIPPAKSGSYYFNYKGTHSLVLMAVVNANCEFIMCDFGINGRISDGGVIEYTNFYKKLKNGQLSLPLPAKPSNSDKVLPFVFVGDESFTLRADFLKPFSRKNLNDEKKISIIDCREQDVKFKMPLEYCLIFSEFFTQQFLLI